MRSATLRLRRYFGLFYGMLVLLIVSIGVWWVVFLAYEGGWYERYHLDRMAADRMAADHVLSSSSEISGELLEELKRTYPTLVFDDAPDGLKVTIDPGAVERVRHEARRRQRMFTAEGIFFLSLPAAELDEFQSWVRTLRIKPTVVELRSHLEGIAAKGMGYVRRRHPPATADAVENSLRLFIKKLLQHPVKQLKTNISETDRDRDLESLQRLFALSVSSQRAGGGDDLGDSSRQSFPGRPHREADAAPCGSA